MIGRSITNAVVIVALMTVGPAIAANNSTDTSRATNLQKDTDHGVTTVATAACEFGETGFANIERQRHDARRHARIQQMRRRIKRMKGY